RKVFDQARLVELAESIRSKGVLSPLLVRPVNGQYEIVAGAQRFRAAREAGLREVPVRVAAYDKEGAKYTIERIAAKTGKAASFIARRLKLLDLTRPVADAFLAGSIGVEHAQLIAKLSPDMQEETLRHCFDGFYGADDKERS